MSLTKHCDAAGVRRSNATTPLIALYWVLLANSSFQTCWLWLHHLLEDQVLWCVEKDYIVKAAYLIFKR